VFLQSESHRRQPVSDFIRTVLVHLDTEHRIVVFAGFQ
jgi:hypothetical protein